MRRLPLLVAIAHFFVAPSARADAPVAQPETPPAAEPKQDMAQLLAAADDITRQVVALRGLAATRTFAKGVLSREAISAKLKERIAKEYSPDEVQVEARVLKRLGLLPPDADYEKLLLDLLKEQVAGFYDPFARQLYIADWLGLDLQRPAMAHEIQHAIQDMHFDLKKFATPIKDDGDRQLAHAALVEGDGTVVMLEFLFQSMGRDVAQLPNLMDGMGGQLVTQAMASSPEFNKAPRFLRETLLFPYISGMQFVLALRKHGPWTKVDAAFRSPPESSEQVMHPEKYLAGEHPVAIAPAPIAALAPWKEVRRDVLGELEWKVLLAAKLPDGVAERAAAGWGGDRLVAYGAGDGPVALVDLSTWDSDEDAAQMEAALRQWMARSTGQAQKAPDQPAIHEANGEAWSVEKRGREVLALFGVPAASRAKIADEVWAKWKVARDQPKR